MSQWVGYRFSRSQTPNVCPNSQNRAVEKFPFQISANQLPVDSNVNRVHFRIHWLVVK